MSLKTFSKFYYGYEITTDNNLVNFDEGGGELTGELNVGFYTLEQFAVEIQRALRAEGAFDYLVVVNRTTRKLTISAGSNFELLPVTGASSGVSAFPLMGFTTDRASDDSYEGNVASGFSYAPQFILQDHVPTANWKKSVQASVNKTASGRVEVIKFGEEQFLQGNIMYITNITQDGAVVKTNGSGVQDFLDFMDWLIKKAPVEYMADIATVGTFQNLILESTPEDKSGTGYKLKELYDKGLPGYFESGILVFRMVD